MPASPAPDLAKPPAAHEIEVTVIGPGFGESVLVHIGDGKWIVVDSCVHPDSMRSAALTYLEGMGFDPDAIIAVVATHYDSDHIKGLAEVVSETPSALYVSAPALHTKDFAAYALSLMNDPARKHEAGTTEIVRVLRALKEQGRAFTYATPNRAIYTPGSVALSHGQSFTLTTLSPSDYELQSFLEWLALEMPDPGKGKGGLPKRIRNDLSVVLLIEIGDEVILLGADLEEEGKSHTGWSAILTSRGAAAWPKASYFKIPHHGSHTGHHDDVWPNMLQSQPLAVLAPWINGGLELPAESDRIRILGLTPHAYASANQRTKKARRRDAAAERAIREFNPSLRSDEPYPGIVRSRKQIGQTDWSVSLYQGALALAAW